MKPTCLFLSLLLFSSTGLPAQRKIDSLQVVLAKATTDTGKAKILQELAMEYIANDHGKAIQSVNQGIELAERSKWQKGIVHLLVAKGNILNEKGEKDGALAVYNDALAHARQMKDNYILSIVLNDIGGSYQRASDYVSASRYFNESLDYSLRTGDNNLVGTNYYNLATLFYTQRDYAKSMDYARKSLEYIRLTNDADKIARAYNSIGNTSLMTGAMDTARHNYELALDMYKKSGNLTGQAILYSQYAILFDPDYNTILHYQRISQDLWDKINPTHYNSIINLGNIGETYLNFIRADTASRMPARMKQSYLDSARFYLDRCLAYAQSTSDMENLSFYSNVYSNMLELSGDYRGALEKFRISTGITDSLFSQANKNAIAGLESKREIELRDKTIQINTIALAAERRQRIALIAGLALLLIIVFLVIRQNRIRRRTNTVLVRLNDQLDEANKVKARFFAILSHDLRSPISNLVSFLELQQDAPDLLEPGQARRQQQQISGSARNLLETMEAMLLWSKGQMEQFRPTIRPVKISSLYAHIDSLFQGTGSVKISYDDPGDMTIDTDENYLQTIMNNLTANAVKALQGRNGGAIRWTVTSSGSDTVLAITDNGPGLKKEQFNALFDDSVVANEKTGLGLHLVRDLAGAIGCRIGVDSTIDSGTIFTLSI